MLYALCLTLVLQGCRAKHSVSGGPLRGVSGISIYSSKTLIIMKQRKFITQYNFDPDSCEHEKFAIPSQTIPDQAYTIRELLEKYSTGIMPPVGKIPHYEEDPDIDDPDFTRDPAFDLSDATRIKDESTEILQRVHDAEQKRAQEKEKADAIEEAKKILKDEALAKSKEDINITDPGGE